MKAMILAAGLGTRLGQHTANRPKALVELNGKPLIAYVLEKLVRSGFTEVVVNVHHFAEQIISYLSSSDFGAKIHISDETDYLLDTGGGILKARSFLDGDEPFLVHNVDIISEIDLNLMLDYHRQQNALATLAVGERKSSRHFLFNSEMQLSGWRNNLTGKEIIPKGGNQFLKGFAFAGIHIINPSIFSTIQKKGAFSIVDAYLSLCASNAIIGYDTSHRFVIDVGKPNNIEKATQFMANS
ncbi:MAG TPA: nucleotidyltransferase family protein [Tenuifilaceae bacterium]|nr:nucleotidyltransferase family protein [Tenuifilaceae bacterium]HPE17981.1 nucleotidyltransferase family protein [Tenuifilaceae bacterium]HPJ44898.1 nucleotidyltransferase family protein [Tenuifilaceae bacterium]HPQ33136.1 nucleotidyltransferase family protein [Tenuifilaceae bacterium]HRX67069.1 nucleotidyltransferase family protein [Tenuifilaceae bacterium]